METEKIRKLIASIYWDLKKDYKNMEQQDCFYDVGMMVGYYQAIDKKNCLIIFTINLWGVSK